MIPGAWLSFALHGAWQGALVALILLMVAGVGRRLPLTLREGLLTLALVKFLVPPFVTSPFGLLALVSDLLPPTASGVEAAVLPAGASWPWFSALVVVQLTGTSIVAYAAVCGRLRAARWRRSSSSALVDATLERRLAALASRLGLTRLPDILIAPAASAPVATGVLRPVVLLPPSMMATLTSRELEALLAHEFAHHSRHHLAIGWIRAVACAVWWWHPLIWIVARQLRSLQEQVCDEAVVRAGVIDRESYCDMLIRAAGAGQPAFAMAAPFADRLHPLGRRIRRLLADSPDVRLPRRMIPALLAVVASIGLPGVPLDNRPAAPPPAVDSRAPIAISFDAETIPVVRDAIALAEASDRVIDRFVGAIEQMFDSPAP